MTDVVCGHLILYHDNVVCLPAKVAASLGNINPICVVYKVTQTVHLIDPITLQIAEMSGSMYWQSPFVCLCTPKNLTEYMVLHVEVVSNNNLPAVRGEISTQHVLAEVWVARMCDLGRTDQRFFCRTHIGHLLHVGDTVLGFDVQNAVLDNQNLGGLMYIPEKLPDVVIVKKAPGDRQMSLQDMLDNLNIADDATEKDGAPMMV